LLAEGERIAGLLVLAPTDVARAMERPWMSGFYQGPF
jgi:hypothetical protein